MIGFFHIISVVLLHPANSIFLQKVQVLFAGMIFQTRSRNAIKAGICSDANKKLNVKSMRIISAEISIFNQNLYFQNPDYLEGSYREEKLLD